MRLTNTTCLVTNLITLAIDDKVSLWGTPRHPIPSSTSKVSSSLRISWTSSSFLALESLYRMKKKTIYKSLMTLVYYTFLHQAEHLYLTNCVIGEA